MYNLYNKILFNHTYRLMIIKSVILNVNVNCRRDIYLMDTDG